MEDDEIATDVLWDGAGAMRLERLADFLLSASANEEVRLGGEPPFAMESAEI